MKSMIVFVAMLASVNSYAAHDLNPDKLTSIGYTYEYTDLSGGYTANPQTDSGAAWNYLSVGWRMRTSLVDLRAPLTDHFTLTGAVGYSQLSIDGRDSSFGIKGGNFYDINIPTSQYLTGFTYRVGWRYYF